MDIDIKDWNTDGRGRGFHHGRAVLVSQAHPGERVRVRVDKSTKGTLQGRVTRLLGRSQNRVKHDCAHAFRCTGCSFLALDPHAEAAFKADAVRHIIASVDPSHQVEPLQTPSSLFGYRHYAKQVVAVRAGRIVLGSYVQSTHDVQDNHGCPILTEELAHVLDAVRDILEDFQVPVHQGDTSLGMRYVIARQSQASGDILVTLVTSGYTIEAEIDVCKTLKREFPNVRGAHILRNMSAGNNLLAGELVVTAGASHIEEEMLGYTHRIGPLSFFQVNPTAAQRLFEITLAKAGQGALCVEAYAGTGALTLPLSAQFSRTIAIEANQEAAGALQATAKRYQRNTIDVHTARTEDVLASCLQSSGKPDVVVLDPPRQGIGATLAAQVARTTDRVILLSCDPNTLTRDLPPFLQAGFKLESVTPVDQFPRTTHVECVTVLQKA